MDGGDRFAEIADDVVMRIEDVELRPMVGVTAMKEWIVVAIAHERKWAHLAGQALR